MRRLPPAGGSRQGRREIDGSLSTGVIAADRLSERQTNMSSGTVIASVRGTQVSERVLRASIFTFLVLMVSAILLRRRPDAHKRLMLLASITIIGPALARISRWPVLGGEQGPFVLIVLLLLLSALLVYDFSATKRVHPATLVGGGFAILISIAGNMIGASEFGQTIVRRMG
jgi:hypothetical protein